MSLGPPGPRLIYVAAALVAFAIFARPLVAQEAAPLTAAPLTANWLREARIAGADLPKAMTVRQIERSLAALAAQNVSVVEADSDLSRFMTEQQFDAELDLMRRYSAAAHQLGLKVVWYYPVLEVLSPKARHGSMYKAHPSWVQQGLDGKPNVFYGDGRGYRGKGPVYWVKGDTESAWMSLHSPYADLFLARIAKIAATGVDGIWLDVPIYSEHGALWPDAGPAAAAKFSADTGLAAPKRVDWNDQAWRRWIAWRYGEISNFILRVKDAAKVVANDISIVVETVTLDYDMATLLALDGSLMKAAPDVIQAWEVDAVSDGSAMRRARPDDWIGLIGMAKFAKAASGRKPSWMFTYGKAADDGLLVMAEALAAGNQPYETKIPLMATTVGAQYRARMFSWIKAQQRRLFESSSAAKVAVYYSPESRDYLDKAAGTGLYATMNRGDKAWWSNDAVDSVYSLTYLAEYRGIIKWLVHNHVPFDIVVRTDADELSRYQVVVAPSLAAISDRDGVLLDQYVGAGGHLVVTGPDPGALDEFGNRRDTSALRSLARRDRISGAISSGRGSAVHAAELPGKSYLVAGASAASRTLVELIGPHAGSLLATDAGKNVHVELRTNGGEMLLHLIDPERLWNKKAPARSTVAVGLALPAGATVTGVELTSPGASPTALSYKVEGGRVSFRVPLAAYAMVVVSTRDTATVAGR